MRDPALQLRRRRPQLSEGDEGRRTASDRNRDNRGHVERRGVVQHLLQFRVVVTCKTTVCRKQGHAGLYRSVYTLQLQTAPTNQLYMGKPGRLPARTRYYSLEIDRIQGTQVLYMDIQYYTIPPYTIRIRKDYYFGALAPFVKIYIQF